MDETVSSEEPVASSSYENDSESCNDEYVSEDSYENEASDLESEFSEEEYQSPKKRKCSPSPCKSRKKPRHLSPAVHPKPKIISEKKPKSQPAERPDGKIGKGTILLKRNIKSLGNFLKTVPTELYSDVFRKYDDEQINLIQEALIQVVGCGVKMNAKEEKQMKANRSTIAAILGFKSDMKSERAKQPTSASIRSVLRKKQNADFVKCLSTLMAKL